MANPAKPRFAAMTPFDVVFYTELEDAADLIEEATAEGLYEPDECSITVFEMSDDEFYAMPEWQG